MTANGADNVEEARVDLRSGFRRVRRDVVQVQLERVRARVLHQPGVADPALGRRAVEGGNHRHRHRVAESPNVFQVPLGTDHEVVGQRKVGGRFGVGLLMRVEVLRAPEFVGLNLFLEQRWQHERRRPCVFEPSRHVEVGGQR